VVREGGIQIAVERGEVDLPRPQDLRDERAGRAVSAVRHDPEPAGPEPDPLAQHARVGGEDLARLDRARAAAERRRFRKFADLLDLRSVQRPGAVGQFETIKLRGVMAGGHHDPAADAEVAHGEVEHGRDGEPDREGVAAGRREPADRRVVEHPRAGPVVVTDHGAPDPSLGQIGAEGPSDRLCRLGVELPAGDAPNVVFAKDLSRWTHRGCPPTWGLYGYGASLWLNLPLPGDDIEMMYNIRQWLKSDGSPVISGRTRSSSPEASWPRSSSPSPGCTSPDTWV